MVVHNRSRRRSGLWTALVLLCGVAGCATGEHACRQGSGLVRYLPGSGQGPRCPRIKCVDPVCYGYNPTCWRPWSEGCDVCPTYPGETPAEEGSIVEEPTQPGDVELPTPAPMDIEPPSPEPIDDEIPSASGSDLPAAENGETAPPEDAAGEAGTSPFRDESAAPPEGTPELPAEPDDAVPPSANPSPADATPTEEGATLRIGEPPLRLEAAQLKFPVRADKLFLPDEYAVRRASWLCLLESRLLVGQPPAGREPVTPCKAAPASSKKHGWLFHVDANEAGASR